MALPGTVLVLLVLNPFNFSYGSNAGVWGLVKVYSYLVLVLTLIGFLFNWIAFFFTRAGAGGTVWPVKSDTWSQSRYLMFWCTFASYPLTQLLLMKMNAPLMPKP